MDACHAFAQQGFFKSSLLRDFPNIAMTSPKFMPKA